MENKLYNVINKFKDRTKKECYLFRISNEKPNITDSKMGRNTIC